MSGSIPCPSCGQSVPPGRLTCPACGSLVRPVRTGAAETGDAPVAPPVSAHSGLQSASEPEPAQEAGPAPEPTLERAREVQPEPPLETGPAPEIQPGPRPTILALPEVGREPEVRPELGLVHAPDGVVPGAYLPPSSSFPPAGGTLAAGAARLPATAAPAARASVTPATPPAPPAPGRASILADLPFDAPDELEGWLVALGGGIGALSFLLPWRASFRSGLEGYFDSWGLGVGAHLPIFAAILVVAVLAVLPNRIATWVRTGVCGMVVGGILLGLVWLYLGGGATEIGAILGAVGGVLMVAGGVLGVAPERRSRSAEDA